MPTTAQTGPLANGVSRASPCALPGLRCSTYQFQPMSHIPLLKGTTKVQRRDTLPTGASIPLLKTQPGVIGTRTNKIGHPPSQECPHTKTSPGPKQDRASPFSRMPTHPNVAGAFQLGLFHPYYLNRSILSSRELHWNLGKLGRELGQDATLTPHPLERAPSARRGVCTQCALPGRVDLRCHGEDSVASCDWWKRRPDVPSIGQYALAPQQGSDMEIASSKDASF
jgi:hypothetical protein